MPPAARYDEPFHWWGPGWDATPRRGLDELLRNGTLDIAMAAHLWAVLARCRSLTVIGGPSGLGKSTLLGALCDLLPAGTRRIYLRGCFETFAFLDDARIVPETSALLINEISPHLPVYLWGPGVERSLAATESGFALLATAHGASIVDFVASLTGSPLRIPVARVAACGYVALLEPSCQTASGRQVSGLWRLRQTRHGLDIGLVCSRPAGDQARSASVAQQSGLSPSTVSSHELAERGALLAMLRAGQVERLPENGWAAWPLSATSRPEADGLLP